MKAFFWNLRLLLSPKLRRLVRGMEKIEKAARDREGGRHLAAPGERG